MAELVDVEFSVDDVNSQLVTQRNSVLFLLTGSNPVLTTKHHIMKHIIFIWMLLATPAYCQMLSKNKQSIVQSLHSLEYKSGKTTFGNDCITTSIVKDCTCIFVFSADGICRKEIIIANTSIDVVNFISDMNEKYYLKTNDVDYYEEMYGLVEVRRINNVFTFEYND